MALFKSTEDCVRPLFSGDNFLGTTFALWSGVNWVTAAHCIEGQPKDNLTVALPNRHLPVERIAKHPEADIAVLRAIGPANQHQSFIHQIYPAVDAGFEFSTFGYPEDTMGPSAGIAVPRYFKGYYQRTLSYSRNQYSYAAAELNIACPGGLSGGPVVVENSPTTVASMVCENIDAAQWLDSVEVSDGERDNNFKILNYGVALVLDPLQGWLRENTIRAN